MNTVTQIIPSEVSTVDMGLVMTPMMMLDRAVQSGASVETLERLMALQERFEAARAKKNFITSMAKARAKFAPILKKNDGYGSRYKYETLTEISQAVDGPLFEHGFSYDWETEDVGEGRIRVTCVVTHEDGHSKRNSLSGHPDETADAKANMNGFQRMGGAVTYLQRYTLKAALGVAAEKDTDGRATDQDLALAINADQFRELQELLEESGSREDDMLAFVKAKDTESMTLQQYAKAKAAMVSKINSKKKATA
jgi:hypothetical protein